MNERAIAEAITRALAETGVRIVKRPTRTNFKAITDSAGRVVDYKNVTIRGYLSTWQSVTPSDRDGDYVVPGAFRESIQAFLRNPVLLANHRNTVDAIAGRFTVVQEDSRGLYVEAEITDSPAEWARDLRWKVASGELQTLSMGGWFQYGEDGKGIERVTLIEGSLVAVPSNPDATFTAG